MASKRLNGPISDRPIEVRPTLIVGAGGTGVLILRRTYSLIKELLGAIPPFIKFLAFDTAAQEECDAEELPAADFFNLRRHLELGEVVRDFNRAPSLHPHLAWLRDTQLDSAIASNGCQGFSRLGRVVFFELRDTVIHREVAARFDALNSATLADEIEAFGLRNQFLLATGSAPLVIIGGSVCGGTGSGLLIDLGYNLRWWSNEVFHRPADIVAHLMLPEAFAVDAARIRDKLRAVALATLEQIEMLTDGRRPQFTVHYRNGVRKRLDNLTAPFDYCYLLSGSGPAGGDHRPDLARMIGTMIRAMTVEPATKEIFDDANNKQLDILGQIDTTNQRRQCFASYGLRYGTPGYMKEGDALVRHWICDALSDLSETPVSLPRAWASHLGQMVHSQFDVDELANHMAPLDAFSWQPPLEGTDFLKSLRPAVEQHIKNQVPMQRQEAERLLPAAPAAELVKQAKEMTKTILRNSATAPGQVAACLELWREHIDKEREKDQGTVFQHPNTVVNTLRDRVLKALQPENLGRPLDLLLPGEIVSLVDKVLQENRAALAKALLREQRVKALDLTHDYFAERVRGLLDLARAAVQIDPRIGSDHVFHATSIEPFATPLFNLVSPAKLIPPQEKNVKDRKMDVALVEQFYQQLIVPLIEAFAFHDGLGDIQQTRRQLQAALDKLDKRMEQFLSDFQEHARRQFHQPAGAGQPSQHRFFGPVSKIVEGATAKIAINQSRRFSEPLDVMISQHPENSCVPDLLKSKVGRSYREAFVSTAYEEQTRIWVHLMNFRYGFSLEALDFYREYKQATKRHLERMKFNPADLWLDPAWYRAYRQCVRNWREQAGDHREKQHSGVAKRRIADLKVELENIHRPFYTSVEDVIRGAGFPDAEKKFDCYRDVSQLRHEAILGIREWAASSAEEVKELGDLLYRRVEDLVAGIDGANGDLVPRLQQHLKELRGEYEDWLRKNGLVETPKDGRLTNHHRQGLVESEEVLNEVHGGSEAM